MRRLCEELEDALDTRDIEKTARIRTELDALEKELLAESNISGDSRKFVDNAERARKSVRKKLDSCYTVIGKENPVLARHLKDCIRCNHSNWSYSPVSGNNWLT